ncbi:MAG: ribonuclease H-like domain-containing protein, partial [Candidatus Eremiobacterota bacterium]
APPPAPTPVAGPFLLRRWELTLEHSYGPWPLDSILGLGQEWLRRLGLEDLEPSRVVFLDTETTGLAGGTGTYAFLIGLGWLEPERVVVEQLMLRDFAEEAALLDYLARRLARCGGLVSFNGKSFDVQLLQTRFVMKRVRFGLEEVPHLDLLHPCRRVWGACFDDCRLQTLEEKLLGVQRSGDVPGWLIPRLFFNFLRSRNLRPLERVLDHNKRDVLALMGLVGALRHCLEQPRQPRSALEDFALGRWLEELGLEEVGWELIERAVCSSLPPQLLRAGRLRLAARRRRSGDRDGAADLWSEILGEHPGDPEASEELAKYFEHQQRDFPAALRLVDSVLRRRDLTRGCRRRFEDRRLRLLRRLDETG